MKLFFTTIVLTIALWCYPVMAQDVNINQTANSPAEVVIGYETITMYSKGAFEIKTYPMDDSPVLDISIKNTTFDVIGLTEDKVWGIVITDSDPAYIKMEYLSEVPLNEYNENDLHIMAHVLAGEAQSQPKEEQLYVGSVVLNRVAHPDFPDTIEGVVFQNGQYACTWDGNYYRKPTEQNLANAKYLLENGSILPKDVVWQSGGKQGIGIYLKTKWHYYCY